MTTIDKLKERKEQLLVEQSKYDFSQEQRDVDRLNEQLNAALEKLNNKRSLHDKYTRDVQYIDEIMNYLDTLEQS